MASFLRKLMQNEITPELNAMGQPIGFPVPDWKPAEFPSRTVMEGQFCRLEPLNPAQHARQLFQANSLDSDNRIWTYLPYGPFEGFDEYHQWLCQSALGNDPLYFAIVDRTLNQALGVGSYLRIDQRHGTIEVGHLCYSPLLQEKSAATEAMYLMMERAFSLGYRRYEWKCHSLNAPSRKAAQRLGFSYEGIFRQAAVWKGRNRDTAWYSIIDREWPVLKQAYQRWLAPENFDSAGQQKISLSSLTSGLIQQKG
jgi:RimJ/RimL family protein N-acetyltransferase